MDKLARLRAARAGQAISDDESDLEMGVIYDEVDEATYREHKRDKVMNDDFIVDDNGNGYAETGAGDDWDQPQQYDFDDDEQVETKAKTKVKVVGNASGGIGDFFKKNALGGGEKKKLKKNKVSRGDLDDIFNEISSTKSFKRKTNDSLIPSSGSMAKKAKVSNSDDSLGDTMFYTANDITNNVPSSPTHVTTGGNILDDLDNEMITGTPKKSTSVIVPPLDIVQVDSSSEEDDEDDIVLHRKRNTVQVDRSVVMSSKKPLINSSPKKEPSSPAPLMSDVTFERIDSTDLGNKESGVLMYWFDYIELDSSLLLFGKVKTNEGKMVSACVQIKGIERHLYVLPREKRLREEEDADQDEESKCTPMDVYEELIPLILDQYGLDSIKAKPVEMKYAFEHFEIPKKAEYLKILMPYETPKNQDRPLPDLSGETFSKIFGTSSGIFESLILQLDIRGPCWLNLHNIDFNSLKNATHCSLEMVLSSPSDISLLDSKNSLPTPSMNLMSINVQPYLNPANGKQEVGTIAMAFYGDVSLDEPIDSSKKPDFETILARPIGGSNNLPAGLQTLANEQSVPLRAFNNEKILLNCLVGIIKKYDPDIFIGHKLENVTLDILLHRMKDLGISQWSNMGRRSQKKFPDKFGKTSGGGNAGGANKFNTFFIRQLCAGRLLCDISNEMGQSLTPKCQTWDLPEMYEQTCKETYSPYEVNLTNNQLSQDSSKFLRIAQENSISVLIIAKVAFGMKILSISKTLTNLAGNAWSSTLGGTRAGRNEFILLHQFTNEGYIVPDKETSFTKKSKQQQLKPVEGDDGDETTAVGSSKKAKYIGGLVFEPEKGLHKNYILVMDFNSLYPSIIQEFNICFTTIDRSNLKNEDELPKLPSNKDIKDNNLQMGVLPRLLQELVMRRREVKSKIKMKGISEIEKSQLDVEQLALKVTANSMYGCLGYINSRFYAKPLAMLVTNKGREILMDTRQLAESLGLKVVYGDTDSVMIDTGCLSYIEACKVGNDFKAKVNQRYKLLEIDIDNIFKSLLLHSKKKYAALNSTYGSDGKEICSLEVKGLDMKRREYCPLSKELSEMVLKEILLGNDSEESLNKIYNKMEEVGEEFNQNQVPMVKLRINTKLSKEPTKYPQANSMPAVQVALRMIKQGKIVKAGNVMTFVITNINQEDEAMNVAQRARSLNEILQTQKDPNRENYLPDKFYYLEKQILNPISRLLEKIPGFDLVKLATSLGLEGNKYESRARASIKQNELQPLETTISDFERFRDVENFQMKCYECTSEFTFGGIQSSNNYSITFNGIKCNHCNEMIPGLNINIQLEMTIRKIMNDYYKFIHQCDTCGLETRHLGVFGKKCIGLNGKSSSCNGVMHVKFTDKKLYDQLLYFKSIFDVQKAKEEKLKPLSEDSDLKKINKGELDALCEQNRLTFQMYKNTVERYLKINGREMVDLSKIFM